MNKKLIISLIIFFSIAIISTILYFIFKKPSTSSLCNKNCKNGKCDTNDTCVCNTGYFGTDCSITCSCKSPDNGSCNKDGTCNCNPVFIGDNCDKCKNSTFTGDKCDTCTPGLSPPRCTTCVNQNLSPPGCTTCVNPVLSPPGCTTCNLGFAPPLCDPVTKPYIVFYDGLNYTGNTQTLPWNITNIYSEDTGDCADSFNNFKPTPIFYFLKPKSIKWSDDVDKTNIRNNIYVRGNFSNSGDTACGPSNTLYSINSYTDITTDTTGSGWIWNNAFTTIGWSPNKDYFPDS